MSDTDTDTDIVNGTLETLRVSEAVCVDDAELLPDVHPPAAGANWSLDEFR